MSDKLRIAIIGINYPHTKSWLETLLQVPEVEIVAMAKGKYENADRSRTAAPVPPLRTDVRVAAPTYDSADALLADAEFDAAWVMLSNKERPDVCAKLARSGKHFFAEKPVARNAREMMSILDAVRENGVKFQTGYSWRFSPMINDVRQKIRNGSLGRVYAMQIRLLTSTVEDRGPSHFIFNREISGGGIFQWLGCHSIDLMLYFIDDTLKAVTARVGTLGSSHVDVEDGGTAIFEFSNGALVELTCGYYLLHGSTEWLYAIQGTEGWTDWKLRGNDLRLLSRKETDGKIKTLHYDEPDVAGYGGQMGIDLVKDFVRAISSNGETVCDQHVALRVLKVIDAIYESSEKGRRIDVKI